MLVLPSRQIHAYLMSHDQILSYQADKYSRRTSVQPGKAVDNAPVLASEGEPETDDRQIPSSSSSASSISHKVASGETLTSIAAKYGVQAADIRSANNLRRNAVRIGQVLTINGVAPEKVAAVQKEAESLVAVVTSDKAPEKAAPAQTQAQQKAQTRKKDTPAKTAAKKETAKNTRKKDTATKSKATTHTIKSGENLGRIAKKYGVTVDAIKKANGMKSDAIRAGAQLKIPAKK